MKNLGAKAFGGLVFLLVALAMALFLPAWTLDYWQAWTFLGAFGITVTVITAFLAVRDPQLLERRVHAGPGAEKKKSQKIIQTIAQIVFLAMFIVPALDHRFGWSEMASYISIAGDVLVVLGLVIVFRVFRENTFTAATIEVAADQKVVSTGPYALVRHPMYSGAMIMILGVPLALASWWGLPLVIPFAAVLIVRLLDEEKFLRKDLPGYVEYCSKVRRRLIPGVY